MQGMLCCVVLCHGSGTHPAISTAQLPGQPGPLGLAMPQPLQPTGAVPWRYISLALDTEEFSRKQPLFQFNQAEGKPSSSGGAPVCENSVSICAYLACGILSP